MWDAVCAAVGVALGVLPHLLHHVSLFAGAALVTGARGNVLFAAVGVALSVPLLRRLYRRFGSWKAPAVAVAVFAALFSLSTFVIGPALAGGDDDAPRPSPTAPDRPTGDPSQPTGDPGPGDHAAHHRN